MAAGMFSSRRKHPASGRVRTIAITIAGRGGKGLENIERRDSPRRIRTAQMPVKLCHRDDDTPRGMQKMLPTSGGPPNRNNICRGDTVEALWICHAAVAPAKVTPP